MINKILLTLGTYLGLVKWVNDYPHDYHVRHYKYLDNKKKEEQAQKLRDEYLKTMRDFYGKKDYYEGYDYLDMVANIRKENKLWGCDV